jgi:hypothetical protein
MLTCSGGSPKGCSAIALPLAARLAVQLLAIRMAAARDQEIVSAAVLPLQRKVAQLSFVSNGQRI